MKGAPCWIWNELASRAYQDGNDYLYQSKDLSKFWRNLILWILESQVLLIKESVGFEHKVLFIEHISIYFKSIILISLETGILTIGFKKCTNLIICTNSKVMSYWLFSECSRRAYHKQELARYTIQDWLWWRESLEWIGSPRKEKDSRISEKNDKKSSIES